ncbi:MAG: Ig-like domain-containing protein [Gammaproteobacteria bacterium]
MTSKSVSFRLLLAGFVVAVLGACSDGDTDLLAERVTIEDLGIQSITVATSKDVIAVSEVLNLTAVEGTSGADLASTLTWRSSDDNVATVAAGGVVTGVADGSVIITASIGGVEGSTMLAVSSAGLLSIDVSSSALPIDVCTSAQFAATGTFADGRTDDVTDQVSWVSGNATAAAFDVTALGLLNTVQAGTVEVTASLDGVTSTALSVVVSDSLTAITTSLAATSIVVDATTTVTASGNFGGTSADITGNATFTSGTTSVATVDDAGTATAVAAGTSVISASCNALQGDATLTVTDSSTSATLVDLDIVGTAPFSVALGGTLQLEAQAEFSDLSTQDVTEDATWTIAVGSSNAASVSNLAGSRGVVTGQVVGTSIVRAVFETEEVTVEVQVVQ